MPRAYSFPFTNMAASGAIARLQFHRESETSVLVTAGVRCSSARALSSSALRAFEIRALDERGVTLDSVQLHPDGAGGASVGLHVLHVGEVRRFQVVLAAQRTHACLVSGALTGMHGLDADMPTLLRRTLSLADDAVAATKEQRAYSVPADAPREQREELQVMPSCAAPITTATVMAGSASVAVCPVRRGEQRDIPPLYRRSGQANFVSAVVATPYNNCGGVQVVR